ncbi:MAG: LLM class flavin-dependent oxidoreductase [Acidimicrobiia bacterium]|nr:LLM class flavin-dependent oxidoreductase [Acidimicrobiia bacterium]
MTMPTMIAHGRSETLAWCQAIDQGPWSSLAVPERVTYPSHSWIVELSAAAAITQRVRLWTTIIVLPAHDAVDVAKQLASVDQLSAGRLTVGIGVGGREHDYRAINGSFDRRWSRMDEQVETMRRVWSGEPPFEDADPVGPPPVQAGGPPFVAGAMGPKALARAAKWAIGVDDGSTVFGIDPAATEAAFTRIREAWSAEGRSDAPHISASLWYALGDDAQQRLYDYGYSYMKIFGEELGTMMAGMLSTSTAELLRESVSTLESLGCDELFLVPTTTDVTELNRTRDALGI